MQGSLALIKAQSVTFLMRTVFEQAAHNERLP